MSTKRTKGASTGPGNQSQIRFNEPACSDKVSESGLNYFHNGGAGLLGALFAAAVEVGKFKQVMIVNNDAATQFVAFGDSSLAAPATAAAGIPLEPGEKIVLASGENTHVRSSDADVFGFVAEENVCEGPEQS